MSVLLYRSGRTLMGAAMVTSPVSYMMQLATFIITNSKIIMHLPHIQLSMCFTVCTCESTFKQINQKIWQWGGKKKTIKSDSGYSEN